ncbi:MAG: response regulator transcription factor [Myxococcota bacterium]
MRKGEKEVEHRIPSLLVVDPVETSREAVVKMLVPQAQQVLQAEGIESAEAVLRENTPSAIVSELKLNDGTVIDLLCALRLHNASLPVVVLTSRGSIAMAVKTMQCGAVNFLTKPASGAEIVAGLRAGCSCASEGGGCSTEKVSDGKNLTLHRAMWEYINRIIDDAGSIHGAARRLGLERRSLQRMLAKNPPPEFARTEPERIAANGSGTWPRSHGAEAGCGDVRRGKCR